MLSPRRLRYGAMIRLPPARDLSAKVEAFIQQGDLLAAGEELLRISGSVIHWDGRLGGYYLFRRDYPKISEALAAHTLAGTREGALLTAARLWRDRPELRWMFGTAVFVGGDDGD